MIAGIVDISKISSNIRIAYTNLDISFSEGEFIIRIISFQPKPPKTLILMSVLFEISIIFLITSFSVLIGLMV